MDWYEELDYEENPFKDNEDTELIGYEEVIDEVLYRIASGNIVCVEGASGAGKTAVLKAAINKFRGTGKLVYLNAQNLDNGLNIEEVFKKKAGFLKRVFNKKPKNMVLFLDEVQNISEKNCERLKYYFDNNFLKSVVLTSSDFGKANFTPSLKDRISKTIKLREMTEDEAVDIVQSRLGNDEVMAEEVIKEIFTKSGRNMKSFLNNCEKVCAFTLENNGKKVLPEHLKEFFNDEETEEPGAEESEVEEPEKEVNKKVTQKTKSSGRKSKSKTTRSKSKKSNPQTTKKTKQTKVKDPNLAVEEPVKVSIVDDFKPEKKEVKMEDGKKDEEIDIDDELKKLKKASKLDDEDELKAEDYEEDYEDFKELDDEEDEEVKKTSDEDDLAEKYY